MIAIYAGSFDPPTKGHIRVIEEALRLFDEIHVLVATNPAKKPLFAVGERVFMLAKCLNGYKGRVKIGYWGQLLANYKPDTPRVLIRGLRTVSDFENEMIMAHVNESLGLPTIFIPAAAEGGVSYVSSSVVRELMAFGATEKACSMVPGVPLEREPTRKWVRQQELGSRTCRGHLPHLKTQPRFLRSPKISRTTIQPDFDSRSRFGKFDGSVL